MNNVWCEDIVHNVMYYVDIKTLCVMKLVNKIANSALNSKHFWEHIFKRDYKSFKPLSDGWYNEYKNVYLAHKKIIDLIPTMLNNGETLFHNGRAWDGYRISARYFEVNIQKLWWLPNHFLLKLSQLTTKKYTANFDFTLFGNSRSSTIKMYIQNNATPISHRLDKLESIPMLQYYMTQFMYNYPTALLNMHGINIFYPRLINDA